MNISKPDIELSAGTYELTAAAHDEIGAMIHIGAAVASIIYASFALDILFLSVTVS